MADSDQILSQAEIDAMLNGGGGDAPAAVEAPPPAAVEAPPPAPPPPAAQEAAPAPAAPPAAAGLGQDEAQALSQRIAGLEEFVQRIGSHAAPESDQNIQRLSQQIQQLYGDLQAINSKVDGVMETLQATVGFGVRSVFACKSCEAQGHVATRLTCTSCGTEEWWGWFPPAE